MLFIEIHCYYILQSSLLWSLQPYKETLFHQIEDNSSQFSCYNRNWTTASANSHLLIENTAWIDTALTWYTQVYLYVDYTTMRGICNEGKGCRHQLLCSNTCNVHYCSYMYFWNIVKSKSIRGSPPVSQWTETSYEQSLYSRSSAVQSISGHNKVKHEHNYLAPL